MPSSAFILSAGLALVSLSTEVLQVSAQANTSWVQQYDCASGGASGANGGVYTDRYGGTWDTRCGQTFSGPVATSEGGISSNGQGFYSCAKGCAKRPRCIGFHMSKFTGSGGVAQNAWGTQAGAGQCYYHYPLGDYQTDTTTYAANYVPYAAARLITANNQLPCPAFNQTRFVDKVGFEWRTYCQQDIQGSTASIATYQGWDMLSCIDACNSNANCASFRYSYTVGLQEPKDNAETSSTNALCYLYSAGQSSANPPAEGNANYMSRIARVVVSTTAAGSTSSGTGVAVDNPQTLSTSTSVTNSVSTSSTALGAAPAAVTTSSSSSTAVASTTSSTVAPAANTNGPTAPWTPANSCASGGTDPNGGIYTDRFGATWQVRCAAARTNSEYFENQGTRGQGLYGCWKGCNNRPGCVAFNYEGTVGDPNASDLTTGVGKCWYRTTAPTYVAGGTYAIATRLTAALNIPCPRFDTTTYNTTTDSASGQYAMYCGRDSSTTGETAQTVANEAACLALCDASSTCAGVSYTYGDPANTQGGEPKDGSTDPLLGRCSIRRTQTAGTYNLVADSSGLNTTPYRNFAAKRVQVQAPSSATTSTPINSASTSTSASISTSTSTANSSAPFSTATCTAAPNPASLATFTCTDATNSGRGYVGDFTNACGTKYQVYCGNNTSPDASTLITAANLQDCMIKCDAFAGGCRAATYTGTNCYMKTSFTGVTASGTGGLAAIVRYVPPNSNYPAPVAATGGGCGTPLPSGLYNNGPSVQFGMTPSDGIARTYLIHIPPYYDPNRASPVIFGFHGNGGTSADIQRQTGMNDGSLNPYAIMVYVQGVPFGISGKSSGYESNPDYGNSTTATPENLQRDAAFLQQLVTNVQNSFCVDATRIFAVGHSNGGGFCGAIACDPELSSRFAAIAPNSGAFYSSSQNASPSTVDTDTPQGRCLPSRNLAIFETHGTADDTIPYDGGERRSRTLPTIPHWLDNWAKRQNLTIESASGTPIGSSGRVTQYRWIDGTGGPARLQHFNISGWGHYYPGDPNQANSPINISPYIMDFFYRFTNTPTTSSSSSSSFTASSTSSSIATGSSSSSTVTSSSSSSSTGSSSSSSSSSSRSSSSTGTSTSAAATATSSYFPAVCPDDDGKRVVAANGPTYALFCSNDPAEVGGNGDDVQAAPSNFNDCFGFCDRATLGPQNLPCTGFSYVGTANGAGAGTCYLKTGATYNSRPADNTHVGATRIFNPNSLTFKCPDDNGKRVADSDGVFYQLYCSADPQQNGGNGDTTQAATSSFNDCFALCDQATSTGSDNLPCTGFTYAGGANGVNQAVGANLCYLKTGTSYTIASSDNTHVGAVRDVNQGPASSSTVSSSTVRSSSISSSVTANSSTATSSTVTSSMATSSTATSPAATSSTATSSTANSSTATSSTVTLSTATSSTATSSTAGSTRASSSTSSSATDSSSTVSSSSSTATVTSSSTASNTASQGGLTTSSTSASTSASATSLTCPDNDNQLFTREAIDNQTSEQSQRTYQVYCYKDYYSTGSNDRIIASSLDNCMEQCTFDLGTDCWGVSWVLTQPNQYCYYKRAGDVLIAQPGDSIVYSTGPPANETSSSSSTTNSMTMSSSSSSVSILVTDQSTSSSMTDSLSSSSSTDSIITTSSSSSSMGSSTMTDSSSSSSSTDSSSSSSSSDGISSSGATTSTDSSTITDQSTSSSMSDSSSTGSASMTSVPSTSSAAPASATATVPVACPADNNRKVVDTGGNVYQLLCGVDVGANADIEESSEAVSSGFNDCFAICARTVFPSLQPCTGFTYYGSSNGVGAGTCYLKSGTSYTQTEKGDLYVGAIKQIAAPSSTSASSSTVSGTTSLAPAGSATITAPATCPADNQKTVVDSAGTIYDLLCSTDVADTTGGEEVGESANNSNDCFSLCTQHVFPSLKGCTAFTYYGADNGAGAGTCFLKGGTNYTPNTNGNAYVAAIKRTVTVPTAPSSSLSATVSTLSSSSVSMSMTPPGMLTTSSSSRNSSSSTLASSSSSQTSSMMPPDMITTMSSTATSSSMISTDSTSSLETGSSTASSITSPATGSPSMSSTVLDVSTSTSSLSSANVATPTAFPYACPANDGQTVRDQNGNEYALGCGRKTSPDNIFQSRVVDTFNDCFAFCNQYPADKSGPGGFVCTAWVFLAYDVGGSCQLREGTPQDFSGTYDFSLVAAIRLENYAGNTATSSAMSSTRTTSSLEAVTSSTLSSPSASSSSSSNINGATSISVSSVTVSSPTQLSTSTQSMSLSNSQLSTPSQTSSSLASTSSLSVSTSVTISSSVSSLPSNTLVGVSTPLTSSMGISSTTSQSSLSSIASSSAPVSSLSSSSSAISLTASFSLSFSTGPPIYAVTTSSTLSSVVTSPSLSVSSASSTVSIASSQLASSSPSSSGASSSIQATSSTLASLSSMATSPSASVSSIVATSTSLVPSSSPLNSSLLLSSWVPVPVTSPQIVTTSPISTSAQVQSSASPTPASVSTASADQPSPSSSSQDDSAEASITSSLSPTYVSISTFVAEETPLPSCGAAATSTATASASNNGTVCQDSYGNTYSVTYGSKRYVGVTKRAVKVSTVNDCLVACNLEPDCVAANYVGDDCTLLSEVTGTADITTGPPAVAATRPPDVSTVYTAPRTVSAYTTPSQPPVYGASSTSSGIYGSMTGSPGSSPAVSTPMMTSSTTSGASASGSTSLPIVNPPYGSGSSTSGVTSAVSSSRSTIPVAVVSPPISTSTSGVLTSSPGLPPSQYTDLGGASSSSTFGGVSSWSNPGVPSSYFNDGSSLTLPGSSSGMATSISHSPPGVPSVSGPTSGPSSSSRSVAMSFSSMSQPGFSTSNNVPPVYSSSSAVVPASNSPPPVYGGSSSAIPPASNISPPPYGASTTSSSPGNLPPTYGGSITSLTATASATPSTEALCPTYANSNYTDSNGATYTVYCGQDFAGTPYNPPAYRRQAMTYTIQSCMNVCDQYPACIAVSTNGAACNLFSSVTGTLGDAGSVAAFKTSGPPAIVHTVTVCANANRVTAYTTVLTTATLTTCPANSSCTAGPAYANAFIATERARR